MKTAIVQPWWRNTDSVHSKRYDSAPNTYTQHNESLAMNSVSVSAPLAMPKATAWQKLQDLSLPHNYVPAVTRTEITTEQRQGVGTSRLVYLMGLIPLRETVSQWREGEGFRIELALKNRPMPAPMRAGAFNYSLSDDVIDSERAVITNSLDYSFSWGWMDASIGVISKPIVKGILWLITRNMKRFYETA